MDTPGCSKQDAQRTVHSLAVLPCHEDAAKDMEAAGYATQVNEFFAHRQLPPVYHQHPMVRRPAPEGSPTSRPIPAAIYVDAVPYSQTDSLIGWWLVNLISQKRYLYCVVRKRNSCRCGCRGWCTFRPIWELTRWSLAALADGRYPALRFDGAWRDSDSKRIALAGQPMRYRMVVLYVKGDWSEYASTLGLPAWNDGIRPCFECAGIGPGLYAIEGNGPLGLRWPTNGEDDYDRACARCEFWVTLHVHTKPLVLLKYDKRSDGARGRAVVADVPMLRLRAGDRLEPSDELRDIGEWDDWAPAPAGSRVLFWRRSEESLARHRCPIFCAETGLTPARNLTIDGLHSFYLGVMQRWCARVIWLIILSWMWGGVGTDEEKIFTSVLRLRHELMTWYVARHESHPGEKLTRVHDFTVKMAGKRSAPACKLKAAETFGMLIFLLDMLTAHAARLGTDAPRLLAAGQALLEMVRIWQRNGDEIPVDDLQVFRET